MGEPSLSFRIMLWGIAKVQGDRKALPLKAQDKDQHLVGARVVPIGLSGNRSGQRCEGQGGIAAPVAKFPKKRG